MKAFRVLLLALGVLVALLAIAVTVAFLPSVQTWAARRALAASPEMRGDVARVDAGLQQTRIQGLRIEQPGMLLTVPLATVEVPLIRAAGKRVHIRSLVAKGWVLDLTVPTADQATASQAALRHRVLQLATIGLAQSSAYAAEAKSGEGDATVFDGVFRMLELPVDLEVDAAELEGEVIFPTAQGEPPGRAKVTLTGGQLGAGQTGDFKLTSAAKLAGAEAPVQALTVDGTLQARMDTPRTFRTLTAHFDFVATGPQFPQGAKLRADLTAERTGADETYAFSLHTNGGNQGKRLAEFQARYPADTRLLSGTWALDAADTDLAAFSLGRALPAFTAEGEGRFETDGAFEEVHASGRFQASVSELQSLDEALASVGRVNLTGDFDILQHGSAVRIERFVAEAAGTQPIASGRALQGIEVNASTGELKVADPGKDLLQITVSGLPLVWAQSFVPEYVLSGENLTGELVASARDGGMVVRTVAPLSIKNLSVAQSGEPLVRQVNFAATVTGKYSPAGWQAEVPELTLTAPEGVLVTATLKAGQPSGEKQPMKATGTYLVDLPVLAKQPALAGSTELTSGHASGDFSAILTETLQQFAAKLDVRDLRAAGVTQPIPNLALNVRADVHEDGLIKLQAPLVLQQGERRSDLDTTAEIRPVAEHYAIDAQVLSELLHVQDAQVLLAPFQGSATGDPDSVPPSAPLPSDKPFWGDVTGELRIALKKVVYSSDVQAANVSGKIKIGPEALTFENLRAVMGEGSNASLTGGLSFRPDAKDKYSLNGDLNVANVNPGPILALLSPERKPTVEGQFDIVGKITGSAPAPETLVDNSSADLKLTSRGGRFNGFAASESAANLGKIQKGVSTVAALAGLFSPGGSKAEREIAKIKAVSDILGRLATIQFDQLNLEVVHRPGEATKIKDFSMISPDLRFVGVGGIQNVPGMSWFTRPLHIELQMAVRGEQARDMKLLGAVKMEPDSLGYFPLLERVPIEGSLSKLSTDALGKLISKYVSFE